MSDSGTTVLMDSELAVRATLFASIPEADLHRVLKLSGKSCWVSPRAGQPAYSTLRPISTPQLDRQSALLPSSKLAAAAASTLASESSMRTTKRLDRCFYLAPDLRHFILLLGGEGVDFRVSPTPLCGCREAWTTTEAAPSPYLHRDCSGDTCCSTEAFP